MPQTYVMPRQLAISSSNQLLSGALLYFFKTGTTTPQAVYYDAAYSVEAPNPLPASAAGEFAKVYLNPTATADYRVRYTTAAGVLIYQEDDISRYPISQTEIGAAFYPATLSETAAAVVPSNAIYPPGDIRRYGAVAGGDNTVAIQAACDSATAGDIVTLTVSGLISQPIVITVDDIEIHGCGRVQQFHTSYDKNAAAGADWSVYNQMFVVNADRVFFNRVKFHGNTVAATSNYFSGSFVWFASGVTGGGVHDCYFQNLRYDSTTNSVAVQTRSTTQDVHITRNKFLNCTGSVSLQGLYNICDGNTSEVTDAASLAPLSATPGTWDQAYGTDGSTGCSVINNKVYISSGAPFSGAQIGANTGATDFVIMGNVTRGLRGGVSIYVRASSYGTVAHNVIDGMDYSIAVAWCMIRVDADSTCVDVTSNTLKGPPVGAGSGLGLDIYTGGNTCVDNKVLFGTNTSAASLLHIGKGTNPAISVFSGNYLSGGGVGTRLDLADNILASTGIEVPIIHRNNTFATPITTPYVCTGASRQIKFYIENDQLLSTAYTSSAVILTPKLNGMFKTGLAANFGFKVGVNLDIHGVAVPSGADYYLATYETGDVIHHSQTVAGGSEGWKCITSGTIPDGTPYSQAGVSTSGSPIITGLANTTLVLVGDYVSPSAGFATTGPFKVIAKTATTLTVNVNSNGNNTPTVTHFAPVFKTQPVVAA